MRIGVVFPQTEIGNDPAALKDYAQSTEELGFFHLLAYDHVVGGNPAGKQKVFKVDCPNRPNVPGGPNGGPPAGGGGLAREAAFTPVAGAAAVGLAAVGAVAWFRLRRRSHGAA